MAGFKLPTSPASSSSDEVYAMQQTTAGAAVPGGRGSKTGGSGEGPAGQVVPESALRLLTRPSTALRDVGMWSTPKLV